MAQTKHGKVRVYLPGMLNAKGKQVYRNIPAAMWQLGDGLPDGRKGPFQTQGYKLATEPAPAPVEAKPARAKKAPAVVEPENEAEV